MDIQDFVPEGGGSLRGRPVIHNGQQVGTFTDTSPAQHDDELWRSATRPDSEDDGDQDDGRQRQARPGRPDTGTSDGFDLQGAARTIRSALRPGV
jgi:hypothetical protein